MTMHFLYEIFPVFLFFIAFKFYNIYFATVVGIVATFIQVFLHRILFSRWDKKQLITLAVFVFFGSMTLYFHNPIFIKWKPTIVFWIFALIILGSHLVAKKTLIQHLMENMVTEKEQVPPIVWQRLNMAWGAFFIVLGAVNLYVAYYFNDDTWVNFKFYGITALLFLFSLLQAVYLMRYISKGQIKP